MTASPFLHLAAQTAPVWEPLLRVPKQTWINLGICIVAIVVIVRVWRVLKNFNELVPYIAAAFAAFVILFYWVYERTEPKFLTPFVEQLTHFFPTKGKQQDLQEQRRRGRDQ